MPGFDVVYVETEDGYDLYTDDARVAWSMTILRDPPPEGYSANEYGQALAALLPTGAAWPREPGSTLQRLLASFAAELARVDARVGRLSAETDPQSTTELLIEQERVMGLPDPCVTSTQTVAERRLALQGRLTGVGGQSRAFFIALALSLGYSVTIDEFRSEDEAIAAGITYSGDSWAHTWRVNVPVAVAVRSFKAGSGSAGEPLRSWGNEVLECQIKRLKPAHTVVLFAYAGS